MGALCATFGEKIWSGHVRSRSYDVTKGTTFGNISAKSCVNATWRGAIDLNGDSWCDWCQYMTSCDPWLCTTWVSRSSKVTWGHWPRLTSQWQIANRHMLSGVSWGAESEFVVHCSQKRLQTTSSSSPRPIIVIRSIWILTVTAVTASGVMPFYLGTLRMLNIATGFSNYTLSCSELNGEHAGEGFRSLRHILLPLWACKSQKCRFSRKFDLWPDLTRSNVDLGLKTIYAIARSRQDASTVFFREALRPSGADRQGGGRTNPLPPSTGEGGEIRKTGEG